MSQQKILLREILINFKYKELFKILIQVKNTIKNKTTGQYGYSVNPDDFKKLLFLLYKCDNNTVAMF